MRNILYVLYQPYKWLVLVPVFAVSTLFAGFAAALLPMLISPRFSSILSGTLWARLNAYLTPIRVTVSGRELIDPQQSYVIAANHQSGYDIYVLYGWLGVDFKWVLKQELRKAPGLGIGCEKLGHIFVDRSDTEAAIRSIEQAKRRIVDGTSVIFFPEGTRSGDGRLLPFKKGAFRMAIDLGLPILPVTLVGTRDILPPNTMRVFPGRARLIFPPADRRRRIRPRQPPHLDAEGESDDRIGAGTLAGLPPLATAAAQQPFEDRDRQQANEDLPEKTHLPREHHLAAALLYRVGDVGGSAFGLPDERHGVFEPVGELALDEAGTDRRDGDAAAPEGDSQALEMDPHRRLAAAVGRVVGATPRRRRPKRRRRCDPAPPPKSAAGPNRSSAACRRDWCRTW